MALFNKDKLKKQMNKTILKLYYNLRKNIYLNIEYYKIIETLPLGYNSRSILISITLLLAVFSTFLLFSKVIYIFEGTIYYQNILNTIFTFFIINIIFIKFNFIVKIYYFIFKGLPYFIKQIKIVIERETFIKLLKIYLIKSLLLAIISVAVLIKSSIFINSFSENSYFWELVIIYSNLISVLFSIVYIDYISTNEFRIREPNKINKYILVFTLILYLIGIYYIFSVLLHFTNLNYTLFCSDRDGESEKFSNYQVNDNIQRNRPASPIFTTADSGDENPQPNVQKNMNIQENVEGSQVRSCQVNKNVQVNNNVTPNHVKVININFINK